MAERIIPAIMRDTPVETAAETQAAEIARVANDKLNQCPICNKTLISSEANGIPVVICPDHSIVMPLKDSQ